MHICGQDFSISEILLAAIFSFCVLYAAITDIGGLRIPNLVSITLIAAFFLHALAAGQGSNLKSHIAVAAITFAVTFAFYLRGWFGAGDAKLVSAIMLWAGPSSGLEFITILAVAGGIFAFILLCVGKALKTFPAFFIHVPRRGPIQWARHGVLPYGVPIMIAAFAVWPSIFGVHQC